MAAARRSALLVGLALLLTACTGGTPAPTIPIPSGALVLRAVDTTFKPAQLSVQADQPFELYFDNAVGLTHNVVIVGPDGTRVFAGDIFSGPAQRVYDVPALASGPYQLHCDVHPEMKGTLSVP